MADSWPTCDQDGCSGACVDGKISCLAHVGAKERSAALERFSKGGKLDVRNVMISDDLLCEIFDAAPHDAHGNPTFSGAWFEGATFKSDVEFAGAIFNRGVRFDRAKFEGDARFDRAKFEDDARFDGATFEGDAGFDGAAFGDGAEFYEATFKSDVDFAWATFKFRAGFTRATFKGNAKFGGDYDAIGGTTFDGTADFGGAIFNGTAQFAGAAFNYETWFAKATFNNAAWFGDTTFEGDAGFVEATFKHLAHFYKVRFNRIAHFERATFKENARFDQARFEGGAGFGETTFEGNAGFGGATFNHGAWFDGAKFTGESATFNRVIFNGNVGFAQVAFKAYAKFGGARFEGDARFDGAAFGCGAEFGEVTFEGYGGFSWALFNGDARFADAMFNGDTPVLGPVIVAGLLDLNRAQFASPVRIEADADVLSCRRGRFPGGVRFGVGRAHVWLDDSDLSAPSLLTGLSLRRAKDAFAPGNFSYLADFPDAAMHNLDKSLLEGGTASGPAGITERPSLLSLQRANVAGLTLGNVDLGDCRFAGCHNLDKLRLEADTVFGLSPAVAGWERRQVIAEESAWRAARARPGRWRTPRSFSREEQLHVISPGAIAVLYRALRKSREDAKDEPGAADFYYGEMEMRRHDRGKGHADGGWSQGLVSRGVLTAYWLVSGYGLRAWRSLAALAAIVAGLAAAFRWCGFTQPATYWKSLLFAFRSTISLTDAQVNLTAWGGLFQAILRLTGPVLLALTLLALRGRVKR